MRLAIRAGEEEHEAAEGEQDLDGLAQLASAIV